MPHDWASIARFLAPIVQKIDDSSKELQALVITSNDELAAEVSAAAVKLAGRSIGVLAATSAKRAGRLLKLRPSQLVAGTPETLGELIRAAAIKLESVRFVCIAWADELVGRGSLAALETLMSELPKEGARTIVTSEMNPSMEEMIERYARRARRVATPVPDGAQPTDVQYLAVSAHTRLASLRRVLDELDPKTALVFVRPREGDTVIQSLLESLGYGGPDSPITVGLVATPGTDLVVLFDLPASHEELREAAGAAARTIALVQPAQIASLRALTLSGALKPMTLPDSASRARDRDARLLGEVRALLDKGEFGRELLALEPLLDRYDGIEIAAAAIQLLERERAARVEAAAAAPRASASSAPSRERSNEPMIRLFVNVGSRDEVRPGDIVGAFTNEGGITSGEVGKIDVRESHSVVEVASSVVDGVIERVTGTAIRGRRAIVRRDEGRREGAGGGDRGDRGGPPRRPREGGRPPRDGGARPPRDRSGPPRDSRGSRPPRGRDRA
jgi:ATP-dependent RNA helicase DeaD